ncbi:MAG: lipopolysaccharide heptosyltransferase II [Betaproteobacteria bacterium]|nr:MAG: lipopolysaccharide heptosyltransferase II [Betaproteobacteria bacterium]
MIMAQGLYRALKALNPAGVIDVLAPAWSAGILARMVEVRRVIPMPIGHGRFGWAERRALGQSLRGQYDRAIVLPNSWKSALVPWFARIPQRTGFVGEFRYGLLNNARRLDKAAVPRLVDRYRLLAGGDTAPQDPCLTVDAVAQQATLARLGLSLDKPVLALCPGAEYGPAKRWPAAYYAAVARAKQAQGWQVWLFGSAMDAAVTAEINTLAAGQCVDLAGQTALTEVVDLLAVARCVVSNDSGLMHLAAAVDAPLIALYGSSDPSYTPPLSDRARVLSLNLSCAPCFKRECPLGHLDCLQQIKPERVIAEMDTLTAYV